jgi:hypothetical protein
VEIEQLAPHLWWWRTGHPDGQGWARDVSSYALVESDDLVLFDPLVPADDEASFLAALDRDVSEHGPPKILVTVFWHARSSREIFDATRARRSGRTGLRSTRSRNERR